MALSAGTRLGPYQILSVLGAGGMGEVYRARDTRLDRVVAIKVLPENRSTSPQDRERFEREARAISSLNHPHICALYDIGQQDGIDYLVMEFLEGETLAHRLKKGPLALDHALQLAIQISDALDTAHKHAVIHRDLKPGNIMLTKSGAKLLDFGLAKVRAVRAAAGKTALPTQTTPLTGEGMILGTLQYMAPEQLEGHEADARTDIFAFGAVVHEMVTARKAFEGRSQASVIAAILEHDPLPVSSLQPMSPPSLDRVVRTCLAKDPEKRWQSARDLTTELEWIAEIGSRAGFPATVVARRQHRELSAWVLVAMLALAAAAVSLVHFREHPAEARPIRFTVLAPGKLDFEVGDTPMAVSPDGRRLAISALSGGRRLVWIRSLDSLTAQALPGTEDASQPFWSPDSRYVAFFAAGKLKKIDISGGPAQTLCDSMLPFGGTWSHNGTIIFRPINGAVHRVSEAGGESQPLLELDRSRHENVQGTPHFLPDGHHFLFWSYVSIDPAKTGTFLGSLDSKQTRFLVQSDAGTTYSAPGFLLFTRQGALMAQPFDETKLRLTGQAEPVAQQVDAFSAEHGVLTYHTGIRQVQLAWYNRAGKRVASVGDPGIYHQIALSPDDRRLVVERVDEKTGIANLWLLELSKSILSRLTFGSASDGDPVWSPDGRQIVFDSTRKGQFDLFRKTVGEGEEELVFQSGEDKFNSNWLRDGSILFIGSDGKAFYRLPPSGDRRPQLLFQSEFAIDEPHVSPDGRWIAYNSSETGRWEVYASAFPSFGDKRQVSSAGGGQALWRKDGRELFYLSLDGKMMSVDVKASSMLEIGPPKALFQTPVTVSPTIDQYGVSADGQRFIFGEPLETETPITVVLNWTAGLKR